MSVGSRFVWGHGLRDLLGLTNAPKWSLHWGVIVGSYYHQLTSSQVFFCHSSITDTVSPSDPPIKRFAQRHIYLGTDAIAARDLGFAMARKGAAGNGIGRTETHLSSGRTSLPTPTSHKRPPSPDYRKCEETRGGSDYPAHKWPCPMSPVRVDSRWDGPPRRRFTPPPAWERDNKDTHPPLLPPRRPEKEREDEKGQGSVLPLVISWFIGQLPPPAAFDSESTHL